MAETACRSRDSCGGQGANRKNQNLIMAKLEELIGVAGLKELKFADLRQTDALARALSAKVGQMESGRMANQLLEPKILLLSEVIRETLTGRYLDLSVLAFARSLTALDYFLKDDDQIPDDQPGGFDDDLKEVSKVINEFADEFKRFKEWKLKHVKESW